MNSKNLSHEDPNSASEVSRHKQNRRRLKQSVDKGKTVKVTTKKELLVKSDEDSGAVNIKKLENFQAKFNSSC